MFFTSKRRAQFPLERRSMPMKPQIKVGAATYKYMRSEEMEKMSQWSGYPPLVIGAVPCPRTCMVNEFKVKIRATTGICHARPNSIDTGVDGGRQTCSSSDGGGGKGSGNGIEKGEVTMMEPRLVDYELLLGEDGKRCVGFGWFAGWWYVVCRCRFPIPRSLFFLYFFSL
jgi:hypothetical protein